MLCMLVLNTVTMQAHTPPSSWYQSPLVAETEQQRVWLNSWQVCVPAMSALPSRTAFRGWRAATADRLSALSCPLGHLQYVPHHCHALAEPGSFATMHCFGAPLLFCKDQQNEVKAFHNVSPAFS